MESGQKNAGKIEATHDNFAPATQQGRLPGRAAGQQTACRARATATTADGPEMFTAREDLQTPEFYRRKNITSPTPRVPDLQGLNPGSGSGPWSRIGRSVLQSRRGRRSERRQPISGRYLSDDCQLATAHSR